MIDVVSAAIIRNGRIFLTQRRWDQSYPFMMESPGGKRNDGETDHAALLRELDEELEWGRDMPEPIISQDPFMVAEFERSDIRTDRTPILLHFYFVKIQDNVWPISREGNGSLWADEALLKHLPLLPGNERARPQLIEEMRKTL